MMRRLKLAYHALRGHAIISGVLIDSELRQDRTIVLVAPLDDESRLIIIGNKIVDDTELGWRRF